MYWGSGITAPRILGLGIKCRRVFLTPRPGRFTAGEIAPSTHLIGGWVDTRTGLNTVEKRKNFAFQIKPLASFNTENLKVKGKDVPVPNKIPCHEDVSLCLITHHTIQP